MHKGLYTRAQRTILSSIEPQPRSNCRGKLGIAPACLVTVLTPEILHLTRSNCLIWRKFCRAHGETVFCCHRMSRRAMRQWVLTSSNARLVDVDVMGPSIDNEDCSAPPNSHPLRSNEPTIRGDWRRLCCWAPFSQRRACKSSWGCAR